MRSGKSVYLADTGNGAVLELSYPSMKLVRTVHVCASQGGEGVAVGPAVLEGCTFQAFKLWTSCAERCGHGVGGASVWVHSSDKWYKSMRDQLDATFFGVIVQRLPLEDQ